MKITVVGAAAFNSLAASLARGATSLGYSATVVGADRLVSGWRPLTVGRKWAGESVAATPLLRALRARIQASNPDVVLVVKGRFITAEFLRGLRELVRCPLLNYYPDHPLWPGSTESRLISALAEYDEVIVWAPHVASALEAAGVSRVRVVKFGYDPTIYRPPSRPADTVWEACLVGQYYPQRLRYMEQFAGHKLFISGLGWPRAVANGPLAGQAGKRTLTGDETCHVYWSSMFVFNILHDWNIPAHNMRSFEIPASGSLMVTNRTPDHVDLFGEDGAILVDSPEEARAAVSELIQDPKRRRQLALNGLSRVTSHTYADRMKEILERWCA